MRERIVEISERELDRLILEVVDGRWHEQYRNQTPIIGGRYYPERHAEHVRDVGRALAAFAWHQEQVLPWARPLPLSRDKAEQLIVDDNLPFRMLGYYGRSLMWNDWDFERHPGFKAFGSGVMASGLCPGELRMDEQMRLLFKPRPLAGIVSPLHWCSPG